MDTKLPLPICREMSSTARDLFGAAPGRGASGVPRQWSAGRAFTSPPRCGWCRAGRTPSLQHIVVQFRRNPPGQHQRQKRALSEEAWRVTQGADLLLLRRPRVGLNFLLCFVHLGFMGGIKGDPCQPAAEAPAPPLAQRAGSSPCGWPTLAAPAEVVQAGCDGQIGSPTTSHGCARAGLRRRCSVPELDLRTDGP